MNDDQLLRYSRHILMPGLGIEAQTRWLAAHVLVVGAGGLGSVVALYLGASGIGTLTVMDHDTVDLTNLQRQIAHTTARVGRLKVESVTEAVRALNPDVEVRGVPEKAQEGERLDALVTQADVVVDCSDNFETRHAINAACVRGGKPLVSGAASGWDGQLSVHLPRTGDEAIDRDRPCYACLFPPGSQVPEAPCATMGVLAPLVGVIGSMQAAETLKLLAAAGEPAAGCLLMLGAGSAHWHRLRVGRDIGCLVCQAV